VSSAQYEAENAWALEINNGVTQAPLNIPPNERLTITNYVWNSWGYGMECRVFGFLGSSAVSYNAIPNVLNPGNPYQEVLPVTGLSWDIDGSGPSADVDCGGSSNGWDLTLAGYLTPLSS